MKTIWTEKILSGVIETKIFSFATAAAAADVSAGPAAAFITGSADKLSENIEYDYYRILLHTSVLHYVIYQIE